MAHDGNVATKCNLDFSETSQNILACVCRKHLWIITVEYFKCNRGRSIYRLGKNLCARLRQHWYHLSAFVLWEVNPSPWVSVTYLVLPSSTSHKLQNELSFGGGSGQKGELCVSWRAAQVNPGEPEAARVFFLSERFRCMLSHINLSWLILQKIWEQFPRVLMKMRGPSYLTIILSWRQSVCLLALLRAKEIAWHHFTFWISRQREVGTGRVNSAASFHPSDGIDHVDVLHCFH